MEEFALPNPYEFKEMEPSSATAFEGTNKTLQSKDDDNVSCVKFQIY